MPNSGRDFEEAVYAFAQTLDPHAEVLFNHTVPDRDTGTSRQCDVWINARFGGHWPISILVSCKDHTRKLDIGAIESFDGEVRSTGAGMGVIYSKSGFSKPALKKAKSLKIICCRLYQNEPPDIPSIISIELFACKSKIKVVQASSISIESIKTWNDLFDKRIKDNFTVLDVLVKTFLQGEENAIAASNGSNGSKDFPQRWAVSLIFQEINGIEANLTIHLYGAWTKYRANIEAMVINGSYCLSDETFQGDIAGPWLDTQSEHPGEQWKEITERNFTLPVNSLVNILYGSKDIDVLLRDKLGSVLLK